MLTLFLVLASFLAGFIDAAAGGGGIILIPSLFIALPQALPATLFGTNKVASICGTAVATWRYSRSLPMRWNAILPGLLTACVGAFLGARTVRYLDPAIVKPLVLLLLVLVAAYTFRRKDFGQIHAPKLSPQRERLASSLGGLLIGFYDGFFGPGTGSFFLLLYVAIFGFDFLTASATAKLLNLCTNLFALLFFIWSGSVLWKLAIPMAAANILGGFFGARLAIAKGSQFVRKLFLLVVCGLIIRLLYDQLF